MSAVLAVLDGADVTYRGRAYRVPPVPFALGLKLHMVREEWDRLVDEPESGAKARAMLEQFYRGIEIMRLIYRPRGVFGWLRQRVGRNPFRLASGAEFSDLMLFALVCRRKSTIRSPSFPGVAKRRSSTRQTVLRTSPDASPDGPDGAFH